MQSADSDADAHPHTHVEPYGQPVPKPDGVSQYNADSVCQPHSYGHTGL